MTTTLTTLHPVLIADRDRDGDEHYFASRQGGITGTDIRDWRVPSKRRAILKEKVTGDHDGRRVRVFDHGNAREPFISEWAAMTHGAVNTHALYAHPENPRHLCTPDGHLVGFTGSGYDPGENGTVVEVKTTTVSLLPGPLTPERVLIQEDQRSHFRKMKYMRQVQWEMYVMNAARCLFIWEPFENKRDPETGNLVVTGPPEWVIIERDQAYIDMLVREADEALEVIDQARAANIAGLPPVSDIPVEEAMLLNDLRQARESAALAEAARVKAWDALVEYYGGEDFEEEFAEDRGFASVSRSIPQGRPTRKFDREEAAKRAPKRLAEHDAFVERYTREFAGEPGKPRLTITFPNLG